MADSIYVKVGNEVEPLDLGGGGSPEYVERIEALEAFAEGQAAKDEAQDEAIAEAKSSAEAAGQAAANAQASADAAQAKADQAYAKESVLPGTVVAWAANSTPSGYLLCNGAAVNRITYAALFSAIGTTYGTGDGSTTFNLPNLTDKFIQGSGTAGTVKAAGLPCIIGQAKLTDAAGDTSTINETSGAFTHTGAYKVSNAYQIQEVSGGRWYQDLNFNASLSSSIYGASSTVQPPALTMRYYIKY